MLKRLFDIAVSASTLFAASPFLILLSILIRVKLGAPVFFGQVRPGRLGQPFRMIKFRTMTDTRNKEGILLPDSERMTRVGKWLRNSSLDELPELWNVLKGEMSLVGPRPLLLQYIDRYTPEQARRHEVKPGITGWAQVNGRNAITWDEKFKLDVWYVENQSFWLDCKILWMTFVQVLRRKDISADGHATMPEFMGNDNGPKQ
jgi:lipopolysaccharide/colanic/teichoic acid biosynthesis glycosyltransferase